MAMLCVTFKHRIDSKSLYDKLNGIAIYEDKERVELKVSVIDLGEKTYVLVPSYLPVALEVLVKCWDYAPFELSVGGG